MICPPPWRTFVPARRCSLAAGAPLWHLVASSHRATALHGLGSSRMREGRGQGGPREMHHPRSQSLTEGGTNLPLGAANRSPRQL